MLHFVHVAELVQLEHCGVIELQEAQEPDELT
jgi:hypothetical protein